MTNRENILRSMRRQQPESIAFDFVLWPVQLEEFRRRFGNENYQEHFKFPIRTIELDATRLKADYTCFYENLPPGSRPLDWNPEWGIMGAPSPTAHFQEILHPMGRFESTTEMEAYP